MKRKTVLYVVLANLALVLALTFLYPELMISPGTLIDAHRELRSDCFACHTPFRGSTPEKCISCHKVEQIGLFTTTGLAVAGETKSVAFHQQLIEEDCVACHSDHNGVKAFRPIGQFSHELLDSSLGSQCDSCHGRPGDALHRKISGNCGTCHTQEAWMPATFDHDRYFRFDSDHTTECVTCHVDDDYDRYTCYGCHAHSRSGIREEHIEEGIYDYENCVECHRSGDEDEAERRWRRADSKHPETDRYRSGRDGHREGRRDEHDDN